VANARAATAAIFVKENMAMSCAEDGELGGGVVEC